MLVMMELLHTRNKFETKRLYYLSRNTERRAKREMKNAFEMARSTCDG